MADDIQRIDEVVTALRKGSTQQAYFFSKANDPRWLQPLREAGLFSKPYQSIRSAEGVRYPSWPQADYLRRIASSTPGPVFDVLMETPETDNERVWGQLADVAVELPPDKAAAWADRLATWIGQQPWLWATLPDSAARLCVHLAMSGEAPAALRIADAMLVLGDEPDQAMSSITNSRLRRARTKLRPYELHDFLQTVSTALVDAVGAEYCQLLLDRLNQSVVVGLSEGLAPASDFSDIWRPLVADDDRLGHDDVRDEFIDALRDALIQLTVSSPEAVGVLLDEMLGDRSLPIVRRVALHVMARRPDVFMHRLSAFASSPSHWADTKIWPEMAEAIQAYCSVTSPENVQEVLMLAEAGHETDALRRRSDEAGDPLPEDQLLRYSEEWLQRRLAVLEEWLPEKDKARLEGLRASTGPIGDPRLRHARAESWVGPTSPLTNEQMAAMHADRVIEYLEQWRPSGEWMSPSYEGLARTLQGDVKDRPAAYLDRAELVAGLHPAYVNSVLEAIREIQDIQPEQWEAVVSICETALAKDDTPVEDDGDGWDYSWRSVRRTVASALNRALERRPVSVPAALADRIWALIAELAEDSDPTPEHEAQYGGSNMDPFTLAINTTRGTAMEAAISYMVWRRLSAEVDEVGISMADLPEVAGLVLAHTHRASDPSLAVRAVIGVSLGRFAWMDEDWLQANLGSILPLEPTERDLWEAAWGAFLNYSRPFGAAVDLFRPSYERSIEFMREESRVWVGHDWREHAGEHLVSFVVWGCIAPDDALIDLFLGTAPPVVSGRALWFLGEIMRDASGLEPEQVVDAQQVWEASMLKGEAYFAQNRRPPDGSSQFAPWFEAAGLDESWRIQQLIRSLDLYRSIEHGYQVVRQLPEFAAAFPVETIGALRRILRTDGDRFITSATYDAIAQIVRIAVASGEVDARAEAKTVVDLLVSRGNYEARGLLA